MLDFCMFINRSIKRSKTNLHDVNLIFNFEKVMLEVKLCWNLFQLIILTLIELLTKQVQSLKNFKRRKNTFADAFLFIFSRSSVNLTHFSLQPDYRHFVNFMYV